MKQWRVTSDEPDGEGEVVGRARRMAVCERERGEGRTGPPPPNDTSDRARLLGKAGPSSCGASIKDVPTCLGGLRFHYSWDRFVAQLSFSAKPVLDIFSVFAAALKIQLMSSASDLFCR